MRLIRSTSSLLASAALVGAPLTTAHAIERPLLTWSGKVDKEVVIQIRGRDVATRASGLDATFSPRVSINQTLPHEAGIVRAFLENGRGAVDVIENPSARNNYTATVRVRDAHSGTDNYRVVVVYEVNDLRGPGRGDDRGDGRGDDRGNGRGDDRGNDRGNGGWNGDRGNDDRGSYDRNRRDAGALRWSGMVDGVAEIRIQGSQINAMAERGNRLRDVKYDVLGASLPRRDVRLEVARSNGRGVVRVVQQPSMWNKYVAIIRIEDARGGYGAYSLDVRW